MIYIRGIAGVQSGIRLIERLIVVAIGNLEFDRNIDRCTLSNGEIFTHSSGFAVLGNRKGQIGDQISLDGIAVARAHSLDDVGKAQPAVLSGFHPDVVFRKLTGPIAAGILFIAADLEMEVGIGKVIESASFGKQGIPDAAGNRDHLICSGADRAGRKLTGRIHLVARHSLKAEYNIRCCIVQPA